MAVNKLTALGVKRLVHPGRYGDGGGLWLQVRSADQRSWLFRYALHGKARQMGLGPLVDVSLAEAREAAGACRRLVREGMDPIEKRRTDRIGAATAQGMTFRDVAARYLAANEGAWRNEKHRYQWRHTLEVAHAVFGARPVAAIATGDVIAVLEPIWQVKTETAKRLRGRIETVLDYATAQGWRSGDNPARWRGHLSNILPSPKRIAQVEHYAALPWPKIAEFMMALQAESGIAARALEFTVLTAARTGETLGATWPEIDLGAALWTVPAARMKAGKEHRVPLSPAAVAVLRKMLPLPLRGTGRGPDWVFPGARAGKALSNMSMNMLVRRMGQGGLTVHGFRSCFRDWCAEATAHSREVAEQALAHLLSDKVEAAYRRGDLLEKRRGLMEDWAEFCGTARAPGKREAGLSSAEVMT
ncbi:MAG: site-specific integrase [Rhodospirillales bacterium]|nr:site-specific integrase [Rhodospirillales bacterium]